MRGGRVAPAQPQLQHPVLLSLVSYVANVQLAGESRKSRAGPYGGRGPGIPTVGETLPESPVSGLYLKRCPVITRTVSSTQPPLANRKVARPQIHRRSHYYLPDHHSPAIAKVPTHFQFSVNLLRLRLRCAACGNLGTLLLSRPSYCLSRLPTSPLLSLSAKVTRYISYILVGLPGGSVVCRTSLLPLERLGSTGPR